MPSRTTNHLLAFAASTSLLALCTTAPADLIPDWIARVPVGTSLSAGLMDMVVDAAGNTYVTGVSGFPSSYTDILTAAFAPDGTLLWSHTYNGTANWHDQSRGIALGPGNTLYVCGNTPGPNFFANVLLLKFNSTTGALLNTVQFSNGPGLSEYADSVVTDAAGNVYLGGGTVGDGTDAMILKFSSAGVLQWQRVWDGPALAPYSLDSARELAITPDGNLVALIHGVMGSLHPNYVVIKYDPADGSTIWETNWGLSGEDSPRQMMIDPAGDIFVTGTALSPEGNDRFGTIRLRGGDGQLLWESYDGLLFHNSASGLALDGQGGVYVSGSIDPDIDRSNSNDNFYSVKLDAGSGAFRWSHSYGDNCRYCFDAPSAVIADSAGHVFITGYTVSAPYSGDMIFFQLDASSGIEQDRGIVAGQLNEEVVFSSMMRLDPQENLLVGGEFYNANTGFIDIFVMQYPSLAGNRYSLAVQNLIGGADALFTIVNATPNRNQYIAYSLRGLGSTFIPQLNVTLDLAQPVLLTSGRADANGDFAATVHVPRAASGRTVWFQGAETNRTTAVVSEVVQ